MKKVLFIACLVLVSNIQSFATHLMGGQITTTNISGNTYDIKMTLYRDTLGVPIAPIDNIFVWDTTGTTLLNVLQIPASPAVQFGNGVEEYVYDTAYTFPANGSYILSWDNCCRNGAILNLPAPLNNTMYLSTLVLVDNASSTPVFLNPPIPIAQINVPFYYNPLPFDADGDSLSWALDIPYDNNNATTPDPASSYPIPGYVLPSSDTSMPFTMNPLTGEISFLPNVQGHFVVSVIATEFRNGTAIGFIRRDMQIIVIPTPNMPPIFSDSSNIAISPDQSYRIPAGTAYSLSFTSIDPDNDFISTTSNGEPFNVSNPALFSANDGYGTATALFTWTPNASQIRSQPYIISLRTAEHSGFNIFYIDHTYVLRVVNPTGIDNPTGNAFGFSVTNDGSGSIKINLTVVEKTNALISISDAEGRMTKMLYDSNVEAGNNNFSYTNLQLAKGIYFVTLKMKGNIKISRIAVTR